LGFIYKIINNINKKVYIGKTSKTIEKRYSDHLYNLKYDCDHYIYKAMRKYGLESFSIESLCECDNQNLDKAEKFYINYFNSQIPNGYNMTSGGTGGDTSKSPNYKKWNEKVLSEGVFSGSNNHMFGKFGENNPNFGSKRSEEQKQRLRSSLKEKWSNNLERKKIQAEKFKICNPGLKLSKPVLYNEIEYNSISEASRITGKSVYIIKKCGVIRNGVK
jgi:group I intron endonuclease